MRPASPAACLPALRARLRPELHRALGDPQRLALLARLAVARGPLTVSEAATCCGVHLSGVSRHLAALREAGVVRAEKRGRRVLYRLDLEPLTAALRGLADALEACREACGGTPGSEENDVCDERA